MTSLEGSPKSTPHLTRHANVSVTDVVMRAGMIVTSAENIAIFTSSTLVKVLNWILQITLEIKNWVILVDVSCIHKGFQSDKLTLKKHLAFGIL